MKKETTKETTFDKHIKELRKFADKLIKIAKIQLKIEEIATKYKLPYITVLEIYYELTEEDKK